MTTPSGNLYHLVGGIAAAWAHSGQRVLLLEEAEDYWRWTMSGVLERRPRHRRKKETEPATPPESTTSTLWASPDGPGVLVHHTCMWEVRHPSRESDRGWPRTGRSPLAAAVAGARDAYDVIVLLPKSGWSYPDRESATAHVALGEINVFPDADRRTALPGPGGEERGVPLSPEQSAAVLRKRCLGFLFGFPSLPIQLDGVIWQSNGELPVDADYLAGVDRDMNRAGLHPPGLDALRAVARPAQATARGRPDEGPRLRPAVPAHCWAPAHGAGRPSRRQELTGEGWLALRPVGQPPGVLGPLDRLSGLRDGRWAQLCATTSQGRVP
ncbi:hypothetical protein [Streptomyces sp. M2CJ-2]|uniref:hypothetical protein n=1 Tax=Streptomyces sp. M2CJ-2 TaxID=2803948 RepID=UPI001F275965|nr:hypothetical protein [Streptomyces sp. M2CJ-2]